MKNKIFLGKKRGIVLITTVLIMVLLLALASFFIGTMTSEFRIASANKGGIIGFYVAESGVEEAMFKVKNDNTYKTAFINGTLNSSFTRDPYLVANSLYTVSIVSIAPGEAQVTSTGKYKTGILTTQRVVKAKIVRGTNSQPLWQHALYGSRRIDIFASAPDITGDLYAVEDINVWGFSHIDIIGSVYTMGNINVWLFSQLDVTGEKHSLNYPLAASSIEMPMVDFDSDNPSSLLNQADNVYTQQQFKDLLIANNSLTLNGITYIRGNIDLKKTQLTVNGLLVADGNIDIGMTSPGGGNPNPTLTVTHPDNTLSGILTKSKINMGLHARNISIDGLIYCLDKFRTFNFANNLSVNGGVIAGELALRNFFSSLIFTYDESRISPILQLENPDSPSVQVEHWEESY